jgi:outer membrane biosynthesis protein TonB
VLKQLLAEHGHPNAVVTVATQSVPPGAIAIQFNVKEGPKGAASKPSETPAPEASIQPASVPAVDNGVPVRKIGDGVAPPALIYKVDPEFTAQARKAKATGTVFVGLVVDKQGLPQNVHVLRGFGIGPDGKPDPKLKKAARAAADGMNQNAVDAVMHYKFKPATEYGKPVPVALNVEVNFKIF